MGRKIRRQARQAGSTGQFGTPQPGDTFGHEGSLAPVRTLRFHSGSDPLAR